MHRSAIAFQIIHYLLPYLVRFYNHLFREKEACFMQTSVFLA